jgi:glycosyltransferase involved in cell wall biosynthesis
VAAIRARFGWTDGRQVVLHAGNMGVMQGLEQVVVAARAAAANGDPVRFVLSGDGNQADVIRSASQGLDNVSMIGMQPDGVHASMLAAADVLLLSERQTSIDMSLPSKLTSYFAAGRPIVAAVPPGGSSAREVSRSGAGLVVPAADPVALLAALGRLRSEPDLVQELSSAGPAFARSHTSADACLARGMAFVDAIAGLDSSSASPLEVAA